MAYRSQLHRLCLCAAVSACAGCSTGVLDLLSGQLSHAYVPDWLLLEDAVAPVDDRVMATER